MNVKETRVNRDCLLPVPDDLACSCRQAIMRHKGWYFATPPWQRNMVSSNYHLPGQGGLTPYPRLLSHASPDDEHTSEAMTDMCRLFYNGDTRIASPNLQILRPTFSAVSQAVLHKVSRFLSTIRKD